ncbi:MAG: LacI family DNA-binding transcriptional regulator [Candidatus Harrisonbacteria bacterium]|nr:LacI family DNA-binding transcriptional regulator [Candidatus Harrisonbacteria bacterium]
MNEKITEETIAREAGVSPSSVSRFFDPTGQERLKPETRAKISPVVSKYDYEPEKRVVWKRKYKTGVFGLLVPFSPDLFESFYHRKVLAGVMAAMEKSKYDLKLIPTREEDYNHMRGFLKKYLIDGLLVLTWRSHPNLISLVEAISKPFPVMLINDYDKSVRANFVYCDVAEGMKKAVDYLAGKGRRKIAFLKGPTFNKIGSGEHTAHVESLDTREKLEGFTAAMKAFNFDLKNEWILECHSYVRTEGYEKAKGLFSGAEKPNAVMCSNDTLAAGVLDYLNEQKIACPGEVSVIGFDGHEGSEFTDPPLTTIRQPLKEMGEKAGAQLIDIAEGRCFSSGALRFKFSPELVIRNSA